MLQVAIILTGNFNFFNYLTMVMCLLLLDDRDLSWLRCVLMRTCSAVRVCKQSTCVF